MSAESDIQQAIRRYRIRQGVGITLTVCGALIYLVSSLIFLHQQAEKLAGTTIFGHLGGVVQNLIADVYQATSPYIGFVWKYAPTLSQENPFSYGNLLFFGLLGVMIVGKQFLLSASQLKRRVQVQLERLEEAQWRNSMQNGTATQVNANQIGQINFYQQSMPPSPRDAPINLPYAGGQSQFSRSAPLFAEKRTVHRVLRAFLSGFRC